MGGISIVTVITFELFKEAGRHRVWELGNKITRFVAPIFMIAVWLLVYYIFINKELQIIYLVK